MIARITAMITYWRGPGCAWSSWRAAMTLLPAALILALELARYLVGHQVDHGEDHDPDHVHEVPVQPRQLDGQALRAGQAAQQRHHQQRQQDDDADRHVRAVETGQHEERTAKQVGTWPQAVLHELRELVELATHERRAEQRRG